jgi:hypothetical protein
MVYGYHNLRSQLFHQPKDRWQWWCTSRATSREDNSYNFITTGRNELCRVDHISTDSTELKGNSKVGSKLCNVVTRKTQLQWMVGSSRYKGSELDERQSCTTCATAVCKLLQERSPLTSNTKIKIDDMDAGRCAADNFVKKRLRCGEVGELEHGRVVRESFVRRELEGNVEW